MVELGCAGYKLTCRLTCLKNSVQDVDVHVGKKLKLNVLGWKVC